MAARKILIVLAALFFGYAWPALFLVSRADWVVGMCLSMLCLIVYGCVRWVGERRDRTRIGRESVWCRRDNQVRRVP